MRRARAPFLTALSLSMLLLSARVPMAGAATAGTGWGVQVSPDGGTGTNDLAGVAAISPNDVWAVGTWDTYGDPQQHGYTLLLHWDGSTWTVVPSPDPGIQASEFDAVAASGANDVWAVGDYIDVGEQCPEPGLSAHWNGRRWKVVPSPNPLGCVNLNSVAAISPHDAWVGGSAFDDGWPGTSEILAEHWDGTAWTVETEGLPTESIVWGLSADPAGDVWAVGQDLIARWTGTRWQVMGGTPQGDGGPFAIAAIGPDDVWVVGTHYVHTAAEKAISHTFTEHWDGTSWTVVPSPNAGKVEPNGSLTAITAAGANDVWAVGSWGRGDTGRTLVLHWNGVRWSIRKSPNPETTSNYLNAVGVAPGSVGVWAVGAAWAGQLSRDDSLVLYHAG